MKLEITLSAEIKRNIFLSVKESLHHIAKHAGAFLVSLYLSFYKGIQIIIADNGKGTELNQSESTGPVLKNMKNRMKAINGSFRIENKAGTKIEFSCPVSEKSEWVRYCDNLKQRKDPSSYFADLFVFCYLSLVLNFDPVKKILLPALLIFSCLFGNSIFAQQSSVIDSLENVLKTTKEDTNKVKILIAISLEYINSGKYDTALIGEALSISEKLNYTRGIVRAYNCMGIMHFNKSEYADASEKYLSALKLSKEKNYKQGMADSYTNIGNVCETQGNYEDALKNHRAALEINTEIGNKQNIASGYNNIGIAYYRKGDYAKALDHYTTGLKLRTEAGDRKAMASSYNNLGNVYMQKGEFTEALNNYFTSLKINEELGRKKNMANAYLNIGSVYEKQANYTEALQSVFEALKLFEEIKNKRGMAEANLSIGSFYSSLRNYKDALKYNELSLKLNQAIGDKNGISDAYLSIGSVYDKQAMDSHNHGNIDQKEYFFGEALRNYFSSLKIKEEIGSKTGIIANSLAIGLIYADQNKFDESRALLKKALELSVVIGDKESLLNCYLDFSILDSAQGASGLTPPTEKAKYWQNAYKYYKLYAAMGDTMLNESTNNKIAEMKTRFETEKKNKEIELLSKENALKALMVEKQQTSLITSRMEAERNMKEVLLLAKSNEVQELKLSRFQEDIRQQKVEAQAKSKEISLFLKDKELKEQELEKQKLIRNMVITGAAMLVLLGFLLFNRYQLNKRLEKQQAVEMERQRISGDMHDDLGSGLSKIAILSEVLKQGTTDVSSRSVIDKISSSAREALEKMGEIVWSLNPHHDSLENLVVYIRKFVMEYMENMPIQCRVDLPAKMPHGTLSGEQRRNIFLTVKEALHNVIRHSEATAVNLSFLNGGDTFEICIQDNGKGIDLNETNKFGNGLRNMQHRMESIGGTYSIENMNGTRVKLAIALP